MVTASDDHLKAHSHHQQWGGRWKGWMLSLDRSVTFSSWAGPSS